MEIVIVIVAFIAVAGFRQWLQHHRRAMIHRERLAAVEKGLEIPR
jgi:Tfp pilus assembly protein PilX